MIRGQAQTPGEAETDLTVHPSCQVGTRQRCLLASWTHNHTHKAMPVLSIGSARFSIGGAERAETPDGEVMMAEDRRWIYSTHPPFRLIFAAVSQCLSGILSARPASVSSRSLSAENRCHACTKATDTWHTPPAGEAAIRAAGVSACQTGLAQLVWPCGQQHCDTNHRDDARSFWRRSSHRMPTRSPDFVTAEWNAFSHGVCLSAAYAERYCLNNLICKRSVLLLPYLQVSFLAICWYGLLPALAQ